MSRCCRILSWGGALTGICGAPERLAHVHLESFRKELRAGDEDLSVGVELDAIDNDLTICSDLLPFTLLVASTLI